MWCTWQFSTSATASQPSSTSVSEEHYLILLYTEKKYKRNTFISVAIYYVFKYLKDSVCAVIIYLSNLNNQLVNISNVSKHYFLAKIIPLLHRCRVSRCWLKAMITRQVFLTMGSITPNTPDVSHHKVTSQQGEGPWQVASWHVNSWNCLSCICSSFNNKPHYKSVPAV